LGNNSIFSTNGITNVSGKITMSSGAKTVFGGTPSVSGNFKRDGSRSSVLVTGTLDIIGTLDLQQNSVMRGTGIVQWASEYIYWLGFSYIYCNNGSKYGTDGCSHVDPPATPLDLSSCGAAILSVELL